MAEAKDKPGQRFPDDYTIAELQATVTRALANGDDYARALVREQLNEEEFGRTVRPRARSSGVGVVKWL